MNIMHLYYFQNNKKCHLKCHITVVLVLWNQIQEDIESWLLRVNLSYL